MTEYTSSYAKLNRFSLRKELRNTAGSILYTLQGAKCKRLLAIPRVQIIEMHYLFPDEESNFRNLLEHLIGYGSEFVSFSRAISLIENGRINKPYITFSFDDGYANCVRAASILKEYGASAIFYLNSELVGETSYSVVERHCRERINKPPIEFMTWQDATRLLSQGHEIGGHTKSHFRMSELSEDELTIEVLEDRRKIVEMCGACDHFAWPYGTRTDITQAGVDTVFSAGYSSCASAVRGAHFESRGRRCFINRDHVIAGWPLSHSLYMLSRSVGMSHSISQKWDF